jgi:transmembrane sensor
VDAGDGITVTATGTEFDVSRVDERVRVALSSGGVVVRREGADLVRMSPGDVIEVAVNNGLVPTRRTLAETISWRSGHLSFNATPLSQAVAEMNRYTDTKLRIVDGESRNEPVSGEFDVDDPKGFARAVNALLGSDTIAG